MGDSSFVFLVLGVSLSGADDDVDDDDDDAADAGGAVVDSESAFGAFAFTSSTAVSNHRRIPTICPRPCNLWYEYARIGTHSNTSRCQPLKGLLGRL